MPPFKSPNFNISDENTGAPFNMALATLYKIHGLLRNIIYTSTLMDESGVTINEGDAQHLKYKFVRQLFVQSIPLINGEAKWVNEMWIALQALKRKLQYSNMVRNRMIVARRPKYVEEIDVILDDFTINIQMKLKKEGYFMPPKDDLRYTWAQA